MKQLEAELAEAKRLLEVRNAELATLQGGAPAPVDGAPAPEATPAEPGAAAPEVAAGPEPAKVDKPQKPKKTVVEPPAPSLLERVTDYWWVLLGLLAAGLGCRVVPAHASRARQRGRLPRRSARFARHAWFHAEVHAAVARLRHPRRRARRR